LAFAKILIYSNIITMEYITASEKETFNLGKTLAKKLKGGEIIGLNGNLGAGKTILAKGIAKGLGIKQNITSPTFILMKIYQVKNRKSKIERLCHIDAYRIGSAQNLIAIGAEEYINNKNTITIIEWVDRINIKCSKNIFINSNKNFKRKIYVNCPASRTQGV